MVIPFWGLDSPIRFTFLSGHFDPAEMSNLIDEILQHTSMTDTLKSKGRIATLGESNKTRIS